MDEESLLARKFSEILPHLDERQRRLVAAAEARYLGHGGISRVSRASGLTRPTIHKALHESTLGPLQPGRVRRPGGGRKKLWQIDRDLQADLAKR